LIHHKSKVRSLQNEGHRSCAFVWSIADMESILKIAKENNLYVIEDLAASVGS